MVERTMAMLALTAFHDIMKAEALLPRCTYHLAVDSPRARLDAPICARLLARSTRVRPPPSSNAPPFRRVCLPHTSQRRGGARPLYGLQSR